MTRASEHAWFNGSIVQREAGAPSVASISFHLGTGVFDGMMAYWNRDHYYLHRGREHLERFREGAARMGMSLAWTVEDLLSGINDLLAVEPQATHYIRPIAYRGAPELWVTGSEGRPVDVSIFTVRVDRDIDTQLSCHVSSVERISSRSIPRQTKVSGAYVNSFNARKQAELAGFEDGLMLDREGRIAEASAANFFAIDGDRLLTPKLNEDVFPGITREVIMQLARSLHIDCTEMDMVPSELQKINGAFLCSTLMEIRGLSKLDNLRLETAESAVYRAVVESFRKLTHQ